MCALVPTLTRRKRNRPFLMPVFL